MSNITERLKKYKNKVFHRRTPGVEDRSRPHSSLDVPFASHTPAARSTASLNDNISQSAIPPAIPNQSQDAALLNPRTASLHSSAHSRVDTANRAPAIEKADRSRSEDHSTSVRPSQHSYSDALVKAGGVAWKGLETALRLLERSAGACPPLKSAVGGLVACLDLTQVNYFFFL
jgi:hypothetical protein